jgi:hypothetical protein
MRPTRSVASPRARAARCRSPLCATEPPDRACPRERLRGRGGLFPAGRVHWFAATDHLPDEWPAPPRDVERSMTPPPRRRRVLPWVAIAVVAALAGGVVGARSAGARSPAAARLPSSRPEPSAAPVCHLSAPIAGVQ